MKYIVEVNAKYLVSIEAESCLNAEHKLLDYAGIWGALAFDQKTVKTDTFLGAVQGCEMVSMNEIIAMSNDFLDTSKIVANAVAKHNEAMKKVKELEALLEEAKKVELNLNREKADALYEEGKAVNKLGKPRN